jgi:hypothetical protein
MNIDIKDLQFYKLNKKEKIIILNAFEIISKHNIKLMQQSKKDLKVLK